MTFTVAHTKLSCEDLSFTGYKSTLSKQMHSKSSGYCFASSCWTSLWCAHAHCDDSIPSQRVNMVEICQAVMHSSSLKHHDCVLGCFCGNLLQYYNSNVEWTPWPLEQASCPSQVLIRQNGPYDVRFEVVKTLDFHVFGLWEKVHVDFRGTNKLPTVSPGFITFPFRKQPETELTLCLLLTL